VSWLRIDDRLPMSVKMQGLYDPGATGSRRIEQRNATIGHWLLVMAWVAGERTDGYVTRDVVEQYGTPASTARLTRAQYGLAPLLHTLDADGRPPRCKCLDGRTWPPGYAYAMHDYLDRNPSRGENDVYKAKKRELRDAKLKRAVRDRDWDMCRYCGRDCAPSDRISDAGLTFDHVDPEIANGVDNLVVACRGCNNRKQRRTPQQADMTLLPSPNTPPVTGPETVVGPDLGPDQKPSQVQSCPGRDGTGAAVGLALSVGPPDTLRGPLSASPYTRPALHAGIPSQREGTP
jgi:5-methylcytosine-specific restriction endonuclease McrA